MKISDKESQAIKAEFRDSKPVTITLSPIEALSVMSLIQVVRFTNTGFDLTKEWQQFNTADAVKKIRDSQPLTITLSLREAFNLITALQLALFMETELGFIGELGKESTRKIHNSLDPASLTSQHLNDGWNL